MHGVRLDAATLHSVDQRKVRVRVRVRARVAVRIRARVRALF